jgi:hypothetical protein
MQKPVPSTSENRPASAGAETASGSGEVRRRRRRLGLWVTVGAVAAGLAAATVCLESIRLDRRGKLDSLKRISSRMQTTRDRLQGIKSRRADYFRKQFFMIYPGHYSFALADFVRRLSLAVTPEVELQKLEIDPDPPVFRFRIEGRIRSTKTDNDRSAFDALLLNVQNLGPVSQIFDSGFGSPFFIAGSVDVE